MSIVGSVLTECGGCRCRNNAVECSDAQNIKLMTMDSFLQAVPNGAFNVQGKTIICIVGCVTVNNISEMVAALPKDANMSLK